MNNKKKWIENQSKDILEDIFRLLEEVADTFTEEELKGEWKAHYKVRMLIENKRDRKKSPLINVVNGDYKGEKL